MGSSPYLNKLGPEESEALRRRLHDAQQGHCFICDEPVDLQLHSASVDIDHVQPLKAGGADNNSNFALTHAHCNRSKQASDLRVARVLARFERIRKHCADDNRGTNLNDILSAYGGATRELSFKVINREVHYSLAEDGDPCVRQTELYSDSLSGSAQVKIFDGQHKASAQVLLDATTLPVRIFIDPDPDLLLLTTNTNAGTTLRQGRRQPVSARR
jgi:hypothetical protein